VSPRPAHLSSCERLTQAVRSRTIEVGRGVVDSDGTFSFNLNSTASVRQLAEANGGWLNFGAYFIVPGSPVGFAAIRRSFIRSDQDAFANAPPMDVRLSTSDLALAPLSAAAADACELEDTRSQHSSWLTFGEYASWEDMSGYMEYGQRADSTITTKYRTGGSWYTSGEYRVSNSLGGAVRKEAGGVYGRWLETEFGFEQRRTRVMCGASQFYSAYEMTPTGWQGGILESEDVSQWSGPARRAMQGEGVQSYFAPSSTFRKTVGKGYTYGQSLGFGGLSVDVFSGWSENVEAFWRFGTALQCHRLWGNNGKPYQAEIIYASSSFNPCPPSGGSTGGIIGGT
jgi:hypothetical protein